MDRFEERFRTVEQDLAEMKGKLTFIVQNPVYPPRSPNPSRRAGGEPNGTKTIS